MTGEAALTWTGEAVDIARIEAELAQLRYGAAGSPPGGEGYALRTSLLNLVVYAPDEARAYEASQTIAGLTRDHPSRALIIVPEIAGIRPTEEAKPVGSEAGEMINEARRGLVALRAKLNASADRHTKEANETLRLLKSPQVKEAIKSVSEAKDRASEIGSHAKVRQEEAKNLKLRSFVAMLLRMTRCVIRISVKRLFITSRENSQGIRYALN